MTSKCLICRQTGHWAKECPNRDKSPKTACYKCHQLGHWVALCPGTQEPMRDADVAHVVGNMEDEGLNIQMDWILYSISLPRASCFLVVPPEDCRGHIVGLEWAQEKSMKQEGKGQGTTFERKT